MAVIVGTAMLGALCGDGELQAKEHFLRIGADIGWRNHIVFFFYRAKVIMNRLLCNNAIRAGGRR